jgi:hypothetical protein
MQANAIPGSQIITAIRDRFIVYVLFLTAKIFHQEPNLETLRISRSYQPIVVTLIPKDPAIITRLRFGSRGRIGG